MFGGTLSRREITAIASCDAVCISLLPRANRMSPMAIPTKNTTTNATLIMPPFRGGPGLTPHSCLSKSSWSRDSSSTFRKWPVRNAGELAGVPSSASTGPQPGLSIRRSGDELDHRGPFLCCQGPRFHLAPAPRTGVSVSPIHWFSTPMSPHDGV